jgi:PAS domain S-box-containing protein
VPPTHAAPPALDDVRAGDRLDVVGVGGVYQDNASDPPVAQVLPRGPADVRVLGMPGRWRELATQGALAAAAAGLAVFGAARLLTRRHERAARETEARYRQLLALSPDAVLVHAGGEVLFANAAAARLLGVADERALAGKPVTSFADAAARAELDAAVRGDGQRARTRFLRADETEVDVEVAASACRYDDRPAVVIVARDVGDRLRYERELRELALLDELTGLHNRRGFLTFAEAELRRARRQQQGTMLVFADLDGLKAINDCHGHAAGDAALCGVARALREVVGAQGLVARWSGDEFVALLPKPAAPPTSGRRCVPRPAPPMARRRWGSARRGRRRAARAAAARRAGAPAGARARRGALGEPRRATPAVRRRRVARRGALRGGRGALPPPGRVARALTARALRRRRRGAVGRVVVHLVLPVDLGHAPPGGDVLDQLRELRGEVVALLVHDGDAAEARLAEGGRLVGALGLLAHVIDLELDDAQLVDERADRLSHGRSRRLLRPPTCRASRAARRRGRHAPSASPTRRCAR